MSGRIACFSGACVLLVATACSADDSGQGETGSGTGGGAAFAGTGSTWPGNGGSSTGGSGGTGNGSSVGGAGGSPTGGSGGSAEGGSGGTPLNPLCLGPQAGAYCGNDLMQDADPNTLYQCPGANQPPTSSTPCPAGCVVESQGTADHCAAVTSPDGYKFPWSAGVTMKLTQDCNDSCCADHVADDGMAWDFANGGGFQVVAARGGTVTHLKMNSTTGCDNGCTDYANVIVIDHGDGTHSTYLHLQGGTLAGGVSCGGTVQQGQPLATAGTTGWSTGIHLHFQVSQVHPGAATCECGADGMGCNASTVPWGSFWSSPSYPTVPITFDEWPATSQCANRRITLPASQN